MDSSWPSTATGCWLISWKSGRRHLPYRRTSAMAAGTWQIYASAKKKIAQGDAHGGISLGFGVFKMSLHTTASSAAINGITARVKWSSIGNEISAKGGYAAGGRNLKPATGQRTVGANGAQFKFTYSTSGLTFTASNATLVNVRYAVIKQSVTGGVLTGYPVCYAPLSTSQFSVVSPNTLTVLPAGTGVFTLA